MITDLLSLNNPSQNQEDHQYRRRPLRGCPPSRPRVGRCPRPSRPCLTSLVQKRDPKRSRQRQCPWFVPDVPVLRSNRR